MLIVTSRKSKAIAFICLILKIQKESQDKKKAKLSLLFLLKFKSDTNTLLFNKIEVLQKGVTEGRGELIFYERWEWRAFWLWATQVFIWRGGQLRAREHSFQKDEQIRAMPWDPRQSRRTPRSGDSLILSSRVGYGSLPSQIQGTDPSHFQW